MSRRPDTLQLSGSQYHQLTAYLRQPHTPQEMDRGRVLLCWHAGLTGTETSAQLALTEARVYALRRAFKRLGLSQYLSSATQGGAPTKLTPQVRQTLARLLTQPTAKPWSLRRLATQLVRQGVVASISTVTVAKGLQNLKGAPLV